jgi:pyruvate/2-oxoglutarate dehydrogenase complex dihydrolipoamide dehydrogenase (E3) component
VPSKTLLKSAHVYHLIKNSDKFGLPSVDPPPVDFNEISKRIKSVISTIQHHDSKERFCRLGVQVECGQATFTDEHSIRLNGNRYSAKTWVIATGSSPAAPPIKGLDQTPHLTNKEIFYLDHLPQSMIILGGGPIGCEMAQAFCRLGTKVSVVDMAPQILVKEDRDLAGTIQEVLHSEGVAFYLDATIDEVKDLGPEKEVILKTKQNSLVSLKAEAVVSALGRVANTSELGLEDIGLKINRQGIQVDNRLRTHHKKKLPALTFRQRFFQKKFKRV